MNHMEPLFLHICHLQRRGILTVPRTFPIIYANHFIVIFSV